MAITRVTSGVSDTPTVSVLSYGAIPNVDSTAAETANVAAFNNALQAMVDAGGGTVYIPAGTYYFSPDIDGGYIRWGYSSFAGADGGAVNLIGEGRDCVTLVDRWIATYSTADQNAITDPANFSEILDGVTKCAFIWADRVNNARISGFSVNMTAGRHFGVQVTGDDCVIDNILVDGGRSITNSGGTICVVQSEDCAVTNCVEQNGYDQGYYILRSKRIRLTNNKSFNQRVGSFVIYGSTDCIVANNLVNGCAHAVTALSSDANARGGTQIQPNNLTVEGNIFLDCGDPSSFSGGIIVSNVPYGLGITSTIYRPRIIGNRVETNASMVNSGDGIAIQYVEEGIVANNTVHMNGGGRNGLGCFNSNWCVMEGNIIKEPDADGIEVFGGIGTHVVANNLVNSPNRNSGSNVGIAAQVSNVTNNTVIIPNGDSTSAFQDFGNSYFVNNVVKGDSTSDAKAWGIENDPIHPGSYEDQRRFTVTKSIGASPTDIAKIESTSGAFTNYVFDIEVTSAGNNLPARYSLVTRGFSGSWQAVQLDTISEYSTAPKVALTASINGADIELSASQTNTANMTVTVTSNQRTFTLTAL